MTEPDEMLFTLQTWRRENMHDAPYRQLPALLGAFLLHVVSADGSDGAKRSAPEEELRAAKLVQAAIFARGGAPDEVRRLDQIYADLSARHPGNTPILTAHGEFLWSAGERERAHEVWERAYRLAPQDLALLSHLGGSFLAQGKPREAMDFYEKAVAAAPDSALHHFTAANVGFMFRHESTEGESVMLQRALAHFQAASRLAPTDANYARAYAETFYLLPTPDWQAALTAWRHFEEVSPNKDFALVNRARIHVQLGQREEARLCLSGVHSPDFARLKARLLEKIGSE